MAHVAKWKLERVEELKNKILANKVVGIVNISGLPSPQLQMMRKNLRGKAEIIVTRNAIISRALEKTGKPNISKLSEYIRTQSALIVSNENPFKLYRSLEGTKTKAPAKGGEIAPEDIIIKAMETPFKPGPIVSELQKAGLAAAIEGGKVVIKKDKLLVKAGEVITRDQAQLLTKLGITPITLGLDLQAVFEDGIVYPRDSLGISQEEILGQFVRGSIHAQQLAMKIGYLTRETVRPLLAKGFREGIALVVKTGYPAKGAIEHLLRKGYMDMLVLAAVAPEAAGDAVKNVIAQTSRPQTPRAEQKEQKAEEKKDEKPKEEDVAAGLSSLFG
ncbi:MAG: 50S ribosomal protein L10 [Thermoplasmata archaeon]|nr:50S ribosomal protein L10 [Thermoplasmata archaeon]